MLSEYLLGITAAAVITAITLTFVKEGPMESVLKLISGLILTFSLVQPVLNISAGNWKELGIDFTREAEAAAEEGVRQSENTVRGLIKEETESYILDKARDMGLEVQAEVFLSDQPMPVPESATIRGLLPPYEKSQLSLMLSRELGIRKENQKWIS